MRLPQGAGMGRRRVLLRGISDRFCARRSVVGLLAAGGLGAQKFAASRQRLALDLLP